MIRWSAVAVLVLAALGCAWLAFSSVIPGGLELKVWDNIYWTGDPAEERRVRHADFGPGLRRHRFVLDENTAARMEGWVFAPRGGQYEFGVESSSDVWVRVGHKTVVSHSAGQAEEETLGSLRLKKGFHPFRVQIRHKKGLSFMRLKWRLPSGYMNLEALQPIFLYPERPGGEPAVPLALRLGPFLLFGLALLVAFGPRLARGLRRLRTDSQFRLRAVGAVALFVAVLGVRGCDIDGAGETSDEWAYAAAGRIYVANIAHGYFESVYWNANEEHPPVGKYVYGLVSHVFNTDSYTPLRWASAFMAALTVLLTYLFAVRFLTAWVGFFAGLVLLLMPHFVAHGKVAALDSPSVCLFTLGVYLFVRAVMATDHRSWRFLGAGLVACTAFATKFSNVLLFFFMGVMHFASEWRNIKKRGLLEVPLGLYVLLALPLLLLFLIWPWLWREPFGQLLITLKHWDYPIQEWFLGSFRQPPPYYFPVYFVATTPALLLLPFGAYLVRAARRRQLLDLVVVLWFLTPFIWTISVLKQDGVRYIYNMYPPLALMIALGADWVVQRVRWRAVLAVVTVVYLGIQCWLVHPYYLDYYSETVGGAKTAYEKSWFEVGWWGEGQKECFDYINANAEKGASFDIIGVVNHTVDALRDDIVYSPRRPDWLIRNYLTPAEVEQKDYTEVFRVEVDAAPLAVVYLRNDLADPEAAKRAEKKKRRQKAERRRGGRNTRKKTPGPGKPRDAKKRERGGS